MQDMNDANSTDIREDEFLSGLSSSDDGKVVGPVKLTAKISKGGMGVVYRGHHLKLDIDVAVKFLFPHLAEDNPEYVIRFQREARMAAKLNNENLVRVFDVDSEKDYHYVVMELVCGETARDRVLRKGPLAEEEAIEILCGAARGLEAAHRSGIVHRDIKPDNVMIDASGLVKLADLGIAKTVRDTESVETDLTQAGLVMGTPSFMPPEQLRDARSVGFPGDVYSMGATLYFLLTGKPPFSGSLYEIFEKITRDRFPDIRDERPDVSDVAVRILTTCSRRDPTERYPDATQLLAALEATGAGARRIGDPLTGTVTAVAKVSTPPARRLGEIRLEVSETTAAAAQPAQARRRWARRQWARRQWVVWQSAVGALLVVAALAGAYSIASRPGNRDAPPDVAVVDESGLSLVSQSESEPGIESEPEPPELASIPSEPEVEPVEEPVEATTPEPEPPGEDEALAGERQRLEESLERARELGATGDPAAGIELLAQLRLAVARLPELSESFENLQDELTQRKNQVRLIARTRQLIDLRDTRGALNILASQTDWGPFEGEAFALELRALLRARPARADEAVAVYEKRCSEKRSSASPDSVASAGYTELLEHAAAVPSAQASAAVWSVSLAYWRGLPSPPEHDTELNRLREEVASKLRFAYLTMLLESAKRAVASQNASEARKTLDDAVRFVGDEGIEGADVPELEELRALVNGANPSSNE